MALNPHISTAGANLALNAVLDVANAGFLEVYDGSQPASADVAVGAQTKLAKLNLSATAFTAASGASKSANAITNATALATSTATWFRIFKSDDTTPVADGSVGTSGANLNLNAIAIVTGATVSVTSLTFTMPI